MSIQIQTTRTEAEAASAKLRSAAAARQDRGDGALVPAAWRERELHLLIEVAHDLRSPLTAILSLAELVQTGQSGEVNETQRRQLKLMYSAALCLCATASDLIELAREGERLTDATPVRINLSEIFASLRDMVRPMVEVRGLELKLESPEPDGRYGFPRALSRVLLNLTTNAVKNTDRGSVSVTARQVGETRMEFSVVDTGRGIAPEDLPHIFEPFRTGEDVGTQQHFSSSGLGLAISRRLVHAMHSDLKVESTPEIGTRFFFEIELPAAG